MTDTNKQDQNRRDVMKVGAATVASAAFLRFGRMREAGAAGSDELRVGLIGCGGRGTGAAEQALRAAAGVKLVAMGDVFKDRLDLSLKTLQGKEGLADKISVPPERQFIGFDAYQKVIAQDVNYVVIATPPGFKAAQIKAAIDANKHVFTEKPMAVDGPTIRMCFETYEAAKKKNLGLGVGLQRHHDKAYLESLKRIQGGAMGDITSGRVFWNQASLWLKPRKPEWSDMEWQMRNWLYFTWLSGDHIVEQHIHNQDVATWFIGKPPTSAVGMGGRQVRTDPAYGHVFDHFAIDYEYPTGAHVMSMARQIPGCANEVGEHLQGTKGRWDSTDPGGGKGHSITPAGKGGKVWTFEGKSVNAYQQEHNDLIESIRKGKPNNELKYATESNLVAIMGRMSAYTGKKVTWEQALNSKESLLPAKFELGKLATPPVAVPGATDII